MYWLNSLYIWFKNTKQDRQNTKRLRSNILHIRVWLVRDIDPAMIAQAVDLIQNTVGLSLSKFTVKAGSC